MIKKDNRGRKPDIKYSKEILLDKLVKLQIDGNRRKLTYLNLEKLTGIPRRNWIKVKENIEKINNGYNVDVDKFKCELALPNIDEVFQLYYGKNEHRLKEAFQYYNMHLNKIWDAYNENKTLEIQYKEEVLKKNSEINELRILLKDKEKQVEHYRVKYEVLCVESTERSKRKEKSITKDVIKINKDYDSQLSTNFADAFKDML